MKDFLDLVMVAVGECLERSAECDTNTTLSNTCDLTISVLLLLLSFVFFFSFFLATTRRHRLVFRVRFVWRFNQRAKQHDGARFSNRWNESVERVNVAHTIGSLAPPLVSDDSQLNPNGKANATRHAR